MPDKATEVELPGNVTKRIADTTAVKHNYHLEHSQQSRASILDFVGSSLLFGPSVRPSYLYLLGVGKF